jgi:bla regulator protein BlaR1
MLAPLFDHLWQSTLFAGVGWMLTLALRKNRARVRHWVWFAASLKFLVPVSLLIAVGSHIEWRRAAAPSNISVVMDEVSQPFTAAPVALPVVVPAPASRVPEVLFAIWACGFIGISCSWWIRWRRIRAAVRVGRSPWTAADALVRLWSEQTEPDQGVRRGRRRPPHKVICSPALLEPGVFGIFRPVLLLPESIFDRLTPAQLQAVIEHELCHVRHRDNLAAAIHMFVETVFWFHPLVWWIGKKMLEERERGCDEEVVSRGGEARVYAEAILNVCKLYVESPLECVAGVTGSDLKKRIEGIMARRRAVRLSIAKKVALVGVGLAAASAPIIVGLLHAQSAPQSPLKFEVVSVKPTGEDMIDGATKVQRAGGRASVQEAHRRINFENINLFGLIVQAYGIRGCRPFGGGNCALLEGGPDWMRKDGFAIMAKIPEDAPDQTMMQLYNGHAPELQLMLQALLADRFALTVHRITKELPVYALTVGKKGPKLKTSDRSKSRPPLFRPSVGPDGMAMIKLVVENGSMQDVVDLYAKFLDRPAVDRTGLKDRYEFTMDYEANTDAPGPFTELTGPSLFKAFEEQLGLKWVPMKAPVEILVIDHAERPSSN